ncbi:hypothetical protein GSY74_08005 [Sulfurovum sp. bin170]|uniref:porin n=1 Tax=Sulfurovum sp. bin170 TaxID=2695268 RepID=UPI0013DFE006|nr:porin [Sulfurovum sp. bin170]NEW61224.1 hypothetical protein [Sulfurovum sp. bin170]
MNYIKIILLLFTTLHSSDTDIVVGGRISLDTVYLHNASGKDGGSNSSDQFFNANNIPIDSKGEDAELALTARNSKLWVKTRAMQENHEPFLTLLEIDFWGSSGNERNSNSHNMRLRHAYFIYSGWTIGQTNSLFCSTIKPATLKKPVDDVFMRQPLISYKTKFEKGSLALSLEQPESVIMTTEGDMVTVNDDMFPDIVSKYQKRKDWGEYSISALARQLKVNQDLGEDIDECIWGYGVNINGKIEIDEKNILSIGFVGGRGIGRYMATSFFPGAVLTKEGKLETQLAWGMHIGHQHWISSNIQLNSAFGWIDSEPILEIDTINRSAWSVHLALKYNLVKNLLLSTEYIHGTRVLQNNEYYSVDRVYFQASYSF